MATQPSSQLSPLNVLVVQNVAEFAHVLGRGLSHDACEVVFAASGAEALRLAKERAPEAVLLDIGLLDMNGYDLARSLRGGLLSRDCPIVALTARGRDEREESAEVDLVLTKPVDETLLAGLLRYLRSHRQRTGPDSRCRRPFGGPVTRQSASSSPR